MTQRDRLLDHIQRIALRGMGERRTDGQLLENFISERDETSFALLLRRHSAMVWSVCHRVLGNPHDADDAFQAAFLVLVRKADSVRPREAVGNWLYGVAYRTALEARGRIARRRAREHSLLDLPALESKPDDSIEELWPILDRELSRLADKYRLPLVLCDLEGRSRKEVARHLAIPEGTLSSRLAMARKKLAARLSRYGFVLTVASLGTLLTQNTATASLSPLLLTATTKAALFVAAGPAAAAGLVSATVSTLTEGVLKTMFLAKIKTATLILCSVAALSAGTGGVYYQTFAQASDSPQAERFVEDNNNDNRNSQRTDREIEKLRRENEKLRSALESERRRAEAVNDNLKRKLSSGEQRAANNPFMKGASAQEQDPNAAFEKMEAARNQIRADFEKRLEDLRKRREELNAAQAELNTELRKKLTELDSIKAKIKKEQAERKAAGAKPKEMAKPKDSQKPKESQKPDEGDRLDRILQRLERLEQRLDRLERGKR